MAPADFNRVTRGASEGGMYPCLRRVPVSQGSPATSIELLMVTGTRADRLSLVYRGSAWNVQYAVARGARLASGKGGTLWYTADEMATLEYLETFRAQSTVTSSGQSTTHC